MAKKKVDETVAERQDELAEDILDIINKKFKDAPGKAAHFLSDDNASDVKEWISSGCEPLNLALSNRKHGGWASGRIIEIFGGEASGKSLLAAHALKSTQEKGGIGILFDTEAATSREFLTAIGVDVEKLLIVDLECLEDIFESIESIIERVRRTNKDKLITIIVDSVMGATTKQEQEADYDKDGWATSKAIILSKAMRKITGLIAHQKICLILINQIRDKLGVSFGNNFTTSGGKAVGFHSSQRVFLKSVGKIEGQINGVNTPVGMKTLATVVKNRLGPPLRAINYDIYFDRGVDDYGSWVYGLKAMGFIKVSGAWSYFEYVDGTTGELITKKYQSDGLAKMLREDEKFRNDVYDILCDNFIMKYNSTHDIDLVFTDGEIED